MALLHNHDGIRCHRHTARILIDGRNSLINQREKFKKAMDTFNSAIEAQGNAAQHYVEASRKQRKAYSELCDKVSAEIDDRKEKNAEKAAVLAAGKG